MDSSHFSRAVQCSGMQAWVAQVSQSASRFHWMLRTAAQRCSLPRFTSVAWGWTSYSDDVAVRNQTTQPTAQRMNSLGIQMLSKSLHKQIFGDKRPRCSKKGIELSRAHLTEQGLLGRTATTQPDLYLKLPPLQGANIDEHFRTIANELGQPYLDLALEISIASLPAIPKEWCLREGWTRYNEDGTSEPVDYPVESALVFDIEVCVKESPRPVLATAVSKSHWYSWASERLVSGESFFAAVDSSATLNELIPMEGVKGQKYSTLEKLIVGHNVSYDRARIREQYFIKVSTRFIYLFIGN